MAIKPERAVWDSCVVIDALQKTRGRYDKIAPFLADAEAGKFLIVISENTVAEVSYLDNPSEAQLRMIGKWFENPYIVRRTVHPGISSVAARLGFQYRKLKRCTDRIILATALVERIQTVHTFDKALLELDQVITIDDTNNLRITEPEYYAGTLFDEKNRAESLPEKVKSVTNPKETKS